MSSVLVSLRNDTIAHNPWWFSFHTTLPEPVSWEERTSSNILSKRYRVRNYFGYYCIKKRGGDNKNIIVFNKIRRSLRSVDTRFYILWMENPLLIF